MSPSDLAPEEVKLSKKRQIIDSSVQSAPPKKKKRSQREADTDALPNGDEPTKKKHKKSKDGGIVNETTENVDAAQAKKDKKEKRKLKKAALAATAAENLASIPPQNQDRKSNGEESEVGIVLAAETAPDTTNIDDKRSKKKHKKSKDNNLVDAANNALEVASSPTSIEIEEFLKNNDITISTPQNQPALTPCISFDQLRVHEKLRSSFAGFKSPTPIQACTWPPGMQGRDVVGIAETGSGKTLAFGIPAMTRLLESKSNKITTLVVAPTRELAIQTHETLFALGEPFGIASVAVFGGVPKEPQIKMLANAGMQKGVTTRIIVGTPGRILDLANDNACDLSNVDYLVLDEADRMLDKGFENDIRKIISMTRQGTERQTMMFSATWPEAVRRLASTFQQDPVRVTVGSDDLTANSRVEQVVDVFENPREKDFKLLGELKRLGKESGQGARILVFALYKKEASRVEQNLRQKGFSVGALHGDMSQSARMEALEAFKVGRTPVLVATDVAARGLDIPNVNTVINYTFPLTVEDYVHRIGRTGRGGKNGRSVTFFTGEAHEKALAGEFARVLRESGFESEELKKRFPMTIKKKTHGAYGAFFRDDTQEMKAPTRIVFS